MNDYFLVYVTWTKCVKPCLTRAKGKCKYFGCDLTFFKKKIMCNLKKFGWINHNNDVQWSNK